tara:strand:+ start:65 stop:652 length:588 start_codon:yes stop_codon:yes gene_type:complete
MALTKVTGAGAEGLTLSGTGTTLIVANGISVSDGNVALASGHGIDFSANSNQSGMTSELLHDYEEGTFTAQLSTGSTTYSGNSAEAGFYTRIGNTVYFKIRFNKTDATINSGSNARFGLPFTASNDSPATNCDLAVGTCENINTGVHGIIGTIGNNSSILYLRDTRANTTTPNLNGGEISSGNFQITIAGVYKVA